MNAKIIITHIILLFIFVSIKAEERVIFLENFEEATVGMDLLGKVQVKNFNVGGGADWTYDLATGSQAISGSKSAHLKINNAGNEWWGLQFKVEDPLYSSVVKGLKYKISFKIKSSTDDNFFQFYIQAMSGFAQEILIPRGNITQELTIESTSMDKTGLANFMWAFGGHSNIGDIWIDDIVISEVRSSLNDVEDFNSLNFYNAENQYLHYMGRVAYDNHRNVQFSWTGSAVSMKFRGSKIYAILSGKSSKLAFYVNGIKQNDLYAVGSGQDTVLIVDQLQNDEHLVTIRKASLVEGQPVVFYGLFTDGELISFENKPRPKLEYFGNSVSEGHSAGSPDGFGRDNRIFDDGTSSYTCLLSEMLNADYHNISISGIAVCEGAGGVKIGMEKRFDKLYPFASDELWDFSKYKPDLCVMALGINDFYLPGDISWNEWRERYKQIVRKLAFEYGENTRFLFAVGPMISSRSEAVKQAKLLVDELNSIGIRAEHYSYSIYTYTGHPIAEEHRRMAKELYDFIKKKNLLPDQTVSQSSELKDEYLSYDSSRRKLTVYCTDKHISSISIYTVNGVLLKQERVKHPYGEFDFSTYSEGVYVVKLNHGNTSQTEKILVL